MIELPAETDFAHGLGAFPSPITAPFTAMLNATDPVPLPSRVDFSSQVLRVRDQGSRGTCVGHAAWAGVTALQAALYGWTPAKNTNLSPGGVYNRCKSIDGSPDGEGTWVSIAGEVLKRWGTVRESDWPYDTQKTGNYIPEGVRETTSYRIAAYSQGWGLDSLKRMVSAFGPCVIVITVPWSFYYPDSEGVVKYEKDRNYIYGSHAILAYGYDDETRRISVLNSWGTYWGKGGKGFLAYEFFEQNGWDITSFVDDFGGKLSGDWDGSSELTVVDAQIGLQMAVGSGTFSPQLQRIGDVTGDGKVGVQDAMRILQKVVGT